MHDEEDSLYVDVAPVEPELTHGPRLVVAVDGSAGSKAALRFALEDAARRGVPGAVPDVQVRAVLGSPADVLVRESQGADLLVVGSRGHGGFHSMLLGSTSIQCATHATCPVTVVHSPEAQRHRLRLHREREEQPQDAVR